jgi:hypothetical protein
MTFSKQINNGDNEGAARDVRCDDKSISSKANLSRIR